MYRDLTMKVNNINEKRSQLGWGDIKVVLNGCYYIYMNGKQLTFVDGIKGISDSLVVSRWLDSLLKHTEKSLAKTGAKTV